MRDATLGWLLRTQLPHPARGVSHALPKFVSCTWCKTLAVMGLPSTGAGNDYSKDRQFRKLNAQKDKIMIKVLRGGQQILVENTDIVVGDVMLLDTGDKVVADAIVIDSQVGCRGRGGGRGGEGRAGISMRKAGGIKTDHGTR